MLRPITKMKISPPSTYAFSALVPVLLFAAACSAPIAQASDSEATGSVESALYGGVLDDDASSNNAVVALRIGNGSPFELCSGVLIAPNVVMTARHCISHNITDDIDCDENGISKNGNQVGDDVSPKTVHVMLGATPDFNAAPAANGKLIFRPTGQTICNTDLAMVVLDKAITSVVPMKIRLEEGVTAGESIRAVGYGQNDKNVRLGTRFRKDGIKVMASGSTPRNGSTGRPAIAGSEFEVGKSICQGDSGGPAISEVTGAVVGIVSRGVDCSLDFGHIYTRTAGFKTLFDRTFAEAGGAPVEEVAPEGAPSASGSGGSATRSASETTSAPAVTNLSATSNDKGCSQSGASPQGSAGFAFGAALVALVGLAVRRHRTAPQMALVRAKRRSPRG